MLTWDVLVLNGYLVLNLMVVVHILYKGYHGEEYDKRILVPLVLLSIPAAVSIHTVTAFLYNGMAARPFWNASILAPRFIASAFCSGPAVMIILFQILRKTAGIEIKDEAIFKIAELMAYAMFFNLFLLGRRGVQGVLLRHRAPALHPVPLVRDRRAPRAGALRLGRARLQRRRLPALPRPEDAGELPHAQPGCVLIWAGVYIEKGMGLVIPGMTPDTLGEIYEYRPTVTEWAIAAGVFGVGFLVFTVLVKVAVPIMTGTFHARGAEHAPERESLGGAALGH